MDKSRNTIIQRLQRLGSFLIIENVERCNRGACYVEKIRNFFVTVVSIDYVDSKILQTGGFVQLIPSFLDPKNRISFHFEQKVLPFVSYHSMNFSNIAS